MELIIHILDLEGPLMKQKVLYYSSISPVSLLLKLCIHNDYDNYEEFSIFEKA